MAIPINIVYCCGLGEIEPLPSIPEVPMPPAGLRVTHVTLSTASIEWERPLDDGGCPITHYILEKRESGWKNWETLTTLPPSVTECELENMSAAKDYFVRIRAVNKSGTGKPIEINTPIRVKGMTKGMCKKEYMFRTTLFTKLQQSKSYR